MSYKITASSDNCYKGTTCLINKLDIRDEKVLVETEAAITFAKASLLEENPIDGSFDFAHFKEIHRFLFCDLYDWAGEIRTIDLSKKERCLLTAKKSIVSEHVVSGKSLTAFWMIWISILFAPESQNCITI